LEGELGLEVRFLSTAFSAFIVMSLWFFFFSFLINGEIHWFYSVKPTCISWLNHAWPWCLTFLYVIGLHLLKCL
jgi:hypothetical protein